MKHANDGFTNDKIHGLRIELGRVYPQIADVWCERDRQELKWGEQNHDPFAYLAILTEEVGELAQAALHARFGGPGGTAGHLRAEAVQCAAVALAIVECLDRRKWTWGNHALDRHEP